MHLKKIVKFEDEINFLVSDADLLLMNETGRLFEKTLDILNFRFLAFCSDEGYYFSLIAANLNEEFGRYFTAYEVTLSNGFSYKDSFWNHSKIDFLTVDEIEDWKNPRIVKIKCQIGYYYGPDNGNHDWQDYFTEISDFDVMSNLSTLHYRRMEKLFEEGKSCDVTLVCEDESEMKVHRNILTTSPYFDALLSFTSEPVTVIKIHCSIENAKALMSFLYTGQVQEDNSIDWKEVFILAMYYNVADLARYCQLNMMNEVSKSIEDVKKNLKFAVTFQAVKFRKYLVKLARKIQEG